MMKKVIVFMALLLPCVVLGANKAKTDKVVNFQFYGTDLQVHFDASQRVKVKKEDYRKVTDCMEWLSSVTDETLKDCLKLKEEMNLCDWAYLKLLDKLSKASLGDTNEATLMMMVLLNKSGYETGLAWQGTKTLRMLFCPDATISQTQIVQKNGKWYYMYGSSDTTTVKMLQLDMPKGKKLSMRINGDQKFALNLSEPRTVTSIKNEDFSFTFQVNKNLIDFYNDLPVFFINDDFMTRWTAMANVPLDEHLQNTLIKEMKAKLAGLSQLDAIQQLSWWVQGKTDLKMKNPNQYSFLYAYDDDVWGYDRAFYAEETLFYPYNDTEDRSILLSRLIRDVLGLKVLFVYYPGHTALAVCITDADVKGAYVVKDGMHFVICDPCYIGSDVGEEMPSVKELEKTIRLLDN